MQAFLRLDAKERVTLRRVLQSIAEKVKSIASKLTGAESRVLLKDADNLLTLAKELNKALKDAGENVGINGNVSTDVKYNIKRTKHMKWFAQIEEYFKNNRGYINHSDTLVVIPSDSGFDKEDGLKNFPVVVR